MHFSHFLKGFWHKNRIWLQTILLSLVLTLGIMGTASHSIPTPGTDPFFYREIALGHLAQVPQPFSARALHPTMVRGLHLVTHISIDQLYFFIGSVCLFLIFCALQIIVRHQKGSLQYSILLFATPFFVQLGHAYYFTDLLFVLLLSIFFLLVQRTHLTHPLSLGLLLLLFLTRESTILLSIICIGIGLYKRQWKDVLMIGVVSAIGWKLSGIIGAMGSPNVHGVGSLVYLAGKFVFNGLRNILGLPVFPNTLIPETGAPCEIIQTYTLPASLARGSIHSLSRCVLDAHLPATTLFHMTTLFGIGPMGVLWIIKKYRALRTRFSPMLQITFWYGILSFMCAPLFGSSTDRLLAMGWPLFLITVPATLLLDLRADIQKRLVYAWLIVSWSGRLSIYLPGAFIQKSIVVFAMVVFAYAFSYFQLRHVSAQPIGTP